jgi:hypothetical protein
MITEAQLSDKGAKMAQPKYKLTIKRGVPATNSEKPGGEMIWLPVGNINLWERDGKLQGRCRVFALGDEFYVFESEEDGAKGASPQRRAYRGEAPLTQQSFEESS